MELLLEQIVIYGAVLLFCGIIVWIYLRKQKRESNIVEAKIEQAMSDGLYEPISLYPVIDTNTCIKSGACITACPEEDVLGIRNGRATTINASRCVGHGACFHACPVEAISLCIGTEKRGVDLPHVRPDFETNVPGIYIAGELGGMGLIKNSVEQGRQAMVNIIKSLKSKDDSTLDIVIVGAGPAGISASLMAKKHGLRSVTLEQDTLGGTVFTFPRSKIVMTSPMDLPGYGKVKLFNTSKSELLDLWNKALDENGVEIREKSKVEKITPVNGHFVVYTSQGDEIKTKRVLLAIGRRGTPRKLNVKGEESEKVAYRLLEPEMIQDKDILVVGGGDSAVESAMLLADQNRVTLSYRRDAFGRIKKQNNEKITSAMANGQVDIQFQTNVKEITEGEVILVSTENGGEKVYNNDLVYIFAGGELPTKFLEKMGILITRRFGDAILSHRKKKN